MHFENLREIVPVWKWPLSRLGCFDDFGAKAAGFLWVVAFLELRENDDLRDKAGFPPLPPTDRNFVPAAFVKAQHGFLLLWRRLQCCVSLVLHLPALPTFRV